MQSQRAAGNRVGYLKRERRRLERAGVSAEAVERFFDDDADDPRVLYPPSIRLRDDKLKFMAEFLFPFFEALVVSRRGLFELDEEQRREVASAREKLCLRELARKYGKIVDKWEQLDSLPFDDPQLEEATKAYLYGFYRASVVLSASALEARLKRSAGGDRERTYWRLVEDAAVSLAMTPIEIEQTKGVFRFRNKVAHEGHNPSHDEAGEALCKTRDLLTRILSGKGTS